MIPSREEAEAVNPEQWGAFVLRMVREWRIMCIANSVPVVKR